MNDVQRTFKEIRDICEEAERIEVGEDETFRGIAIGKVLRTLLPWSLIEMEQFPGIYRKLAEDMHSPHRRTKVHEWSFELCNHPVCEESRRVLVGLGEEDKAAVV